MINRGFAMISHQKNAEKQPQIDQSNLINHWVDKAQKHYQRQNKSGARYWAEKVTKIDLDNILALNLLGRIALDDNRLDDACNLLKQALKKAPSDNSTLLNLGYTYLAMADYKRADDVFDLILECSPEHKNARISVAYSQLLQGQFEVALTQYRTLYREGVTNPHIISGMADCCAQLQAKSYLPELEADLISLYRHLIHSAQIRAEQLGSLTNSILIHKYQLDKADSQIDIKDLAADPLLIALIEQGQVNCTEIESLVVAIRASILLEANETGQINNDYLAIAHAISCQAAANYYLFDHSHNESIALESLRGKIKSSLNDSWKPDDLTGALLLLSLYEPIDTQDFSWKIAKYDLSDWPVGIQQVMNLHFYQAQGRNAINYELKNQTCLSSLQHEEKDQFPPVKLWQTLAYQGASSYVHAIQNELSNCSIAVNKLYEPGKALVIGCDAGFNALSLAYNYPELSIVATEPSIEGLSHAIIKAQEYQLTNIEFRHGSLEQVINNEQYDFIECGRYLNYVNEVNTSLHQLLEALNPDGIIKLGLNKQSHNEEVEQLRAFIKERDLSCDHTHIRALRSSIIEAHSEDALWNNVIQSNWFYHYNDIINELFTKQNEYTKQDVTHLCQLHEMNFLGFSQLNTQAQQKAISHSETPKDNLDFYANRFEGANDDMIFIKPALLV